jgi:hypothetical protein
MNSNLRLKDLITLSDTLQKLAIIEVLHKKD